MNTVFSPTSNFDTEQCFECPVRADCTAGTLVEAVDEELVDHAAVVYASFSQRVAGDIADGSFDTKEEVLRSLDEAAMRAKKVKEALGEALTLTAGLESWIAVQHFSLDDREMALDEIYDILADAPHPTDLLARVELPDTIAQASKDIPRFVRQGICRAISGEQRPPNWLRVIK